MSEYVDHFVKNRIDTEVLPDLTEHDLEKLGVFHGDRRKMLRAIPALASNTPPAATQARRHDAAQRRQLTIVLHDLVGSTALSTRFDPKDLREIISSYHKHCAEVIVKHGGFVAR